MDSQIERPQGYGYDQEPRNAAFHAEGEDDHHNEKKSVLKKVKAKAKKIKDTLKLHGHGQGYEQDHLQHEGHHVPDDHDLEEEDDEEEDEEMVMDPETHGGSAFESAVIRSSLPLQVEKLGDSVETRDSNKAKVTDSVRSSFPIQEEDQGRKLAVGKTSDVKEVPHALLNKPASITPGIVEQTKSVDPVESFAREQEAIRGLPEVHLEGQMDLEEDPDAPKDRPEDYIPSNYQTKVADPTGAGGKEIDVTPIVRSFKEVNIHDEPKPEAEDQSIFPTGSHDQFSPGPTSPIPITSQESPKSVSKTSNDDAAEKTSKQGSYTEKISSAISDKAISAKNVVASKLGYGEKGDNKEHEGEEHAKATSPVEYGKKIAATVTEKISPVYEKVAETGSNMISKVPGMGTETANEEESKVKGQDKGVSMKNYLAEKLKPGEEDKALSEVISEALHKPKAEENENGNKNKPTGKVTESEKVKKQLAITEENSDERVDPSSVHNAGSAMVDKLKGVVGSVFGKGTETRGSTTGTTVFSGDETGERRLQESGN